jgi:hypothetical protein
LPEPPAEKAEYSTSSFGGFFFVTVLHQRKRCERSRCEWQSVSLSNVPLFHDEHRGTARALSLQLAHVSLPVLAVSCLSSSLDVA